MAVSREAVVESAKSFERTPWRHGARIKGLGIDCTGLVICSFNECGAEIEDIYDYSLFDEFTKLVRTLNRYCDKVSRKVLPGDILLFRGDDMLNHVGIVTDEKNFIHAYSVPSVMLVTIQPYDAYWKQRLRGIYSFKGFVN